MRTAHTPRGRHHCNRPGSRRVNDYSHRPGSFRELWSTYEPGQVFSILQARGISSCTVLRTNIRTAFSVATTVFSIVVVCNLAGTTIEEQQGVVCIPASDLLMTLDSDSRTAVFATVIRTVMIFLKRTTVMTADNGIYQIDLNTLTLTIRRGSDKATLSVEQLHRSNSLELFITSHPYKRLVTSCK